MPVKMILARGGRRRGCSGVRASAAVLSSGRPAPAGQREPSMRCGPHIKAAAIRGHFRYQKSG